MMAHTFLSLDMDLIPRSTKDNVPTFWLGYFSNDNSRILLDGNNKENNLVHRIEALRAWVQWSADPDLIITQLLSTAIEHTKEELEVLKNDTSSIWYVDPKGLI